MPRSRLIVVWRATDRCDTACPFCAFDARLRRPRRDLDAGEALRFGGLVARWAAGQGREVLLCWLGGEPLLWAPLRAVSAELAARGLSVAVTTNGRALGEPAWRRFVLETLDELTLSLDGPPAVHDALRRAPGCARAVLDALGALRAARGPRARPRLRVNAVLTRATAAHLPALVELVARAGADELTFNALGGADRPEYFPANRLRPEDVAALEARLPALRAAAGRSGLRLCGAGAYLARLRAVAAGAPTPVADCSPGDGLWFVEVDGRLAPCSFTVAEHGVPLASLVTPADLSALPARFAAARARRPAPACADCASTQVHAKYAEDAA